MRRTGAPLRLALVLVLPILVACGGATAPPAATTAASTEAAPSAEAASAAAPAEASPAASSAASAEASAEESSAATASVPAMEPGTAAASPINDKVIVVGENQEPDTFFAIESTALATSEVLFPTGACITTLTYAYQPTYCFDELPTFANGGAVTETVEVDPAAISEDNPIEVEGFVVTDTAVAAEAGIDIPEQLGQLTLTYKLRPDLRWEDGEPVTSADYLEMFRVQQDPETMLATRQYVERTASVEAPDDQTIVQTMVPGYIESAYNVNPWFSFLPAHLYADKPVSEIRDAEAAHPMSFGPFMLQEHQPGVQTTLVSNPFFAMQPKVGTLIFKYISDVNQELAQLETGEIDIPSAADVTLDLTPRLDELEASGAIETQYVPSTFWEHIDFGIERGDGEPSFFDDVRIRQAVAHAINRQEIIDNVQAGKTTVMNTIIPADHPAYPGDDALDPYEYDPDKAQALLEEAGVTDSDGDGIREKDGRPLTMTFYTTEGRADRQAAAEIIQQNLAQVGFDIALEFVPGPEKLFKAGADGILQSRTFDLAMYSFLSGVEPGVELYVCELIPSAENGYNGQNRPAYCNPEYDEQAYAALRELDLTKFKQAYNGALTIINRDLPTFPLFQRVKIGAYKSGLTGVKIDPTQNQMTYNTEEWDIE